MPHRKEEFINDEIYHIVTRGIGDTEIFKNVDDYYRGIFSIYEFNNSNPVSIYRRRKERTLFKKNFAEFVELTRTGLVQVKQGPSSNIFTERDRRNRLVSCLAFVLMPNHLHLLLKQLVDNGIIKFMSKLGTGFGGYFNRKYDRKGYVFQNRFKDVHIKDEEQLKTAFVYIHTNPISLLEPGWKEKGINDVEKAMKFLEDYRWSSYPDYIGKKNFPSVTDREFLLKVVGGSEGCREFARGWLNYKGEIGEFPELYLE